MIHFAVRFPNTGNFSSVDENVIEHRCSTVSRSSFETDTTDGKKGRLNALEALVIVENSFTQTSRTSYSFFDDSEKTQRCVEGRERARAQKKRLFR